VFFSRGYIYTPGARGGVRIEKDFHDDWTFFRTGGIAVPDYGYHTRDMTDDDIGAPSENPPRGGLLSAVEKLVNEPPPPLYFHLGRWTNSLLQLAVAVLRTLRSLRRPAGRMAWQTVVRRRRNAPRRNSSCTRAAPKPQGSHHRACRPRYRG